MRRAIGSLVRLLAATLAPLALLSWSAPARGAAPPFPAQAFRPLVPPAGRPPGGLAAGKDAEGRWRWPDLSAFRERFERYDADARPVRVIEADAEGKVWDRPLAVRGAHLAVRREGERVWLDLVAPREAADDHAYALRGPWRVASGRLDAPGAAVLRGESGARMEVRVSRVSPATAIPAAAWADWVYVAGLLEAERPVMREFHIPVGRCSMDERPRQVAAEHAERCYREGRLSCYLQFQVRLINDALPRVAWSSWGEQVAHTGADRLAESGLDVDRFFVGLLLDLGAERPRRDGAGPFRLARAIAESGRADALDARLSALAQDPALDEWNRTRAAITLALVRARRAGAFDVPLRDRGKGWDPVGSVAPSLGGMDLAPAARAWLRL